MNGTDGTDASGDEKRRSTPGTDAGPGAGGQAGNPGIAAGHIEVHVGSFAPGCALLLSAAGGPGGKGQNGQAGGRGGDGGKSDIIKIYWPPTIIKPPNAPDWLPYDSGSYPGSGGRGGDAGIGGKGGDGGSIVMNAQCPIPDTIQCRVSAGAGGSSGTPGKAGSMGTSKINLLFTLLVPPVGTIPHLAAAGNLPSPPAAAGAIGQVALNPSIVPKMQSGSPGPFAAAANYAQCSMLLDRAKAYYLAGGPAYPQHLVAAEARLSWLLDVLADGYGGGPSSDPTAAPWTRLFSIVVALLRQLHKGKDGKGNVFPRDVYGLDYSYVPLVPFTPFNNDLMTMKDLFKDLEAAYLGYLANYRDDQKTKDNINASLDKLGGLQADQDRRLKDVAAKANSTEEQIQDALVELEHRRSALLAAVADAEQAIRNYSDCSLANSMDGLQMLAMVPPVASGKEGMELSGAGVLMAGAEAYSMLDSAASNITTTDADGNKITVNKQFILSKIDRIDASLASLKDTYSVNQGLITDNPDIPRAIVDAEDLKKYLAEVEDKVPEVKPAEEAADAFIAAITNRGNLILQYNDLVCAITRLCAERDDTKQRTADLKTKFSDMTSDAALPVVVAWMSRMYEELRGELTYSCFLLSRIYQFAFLDTTAPSIGIEALDDPRGFNVATLETFLVNLKFSQEQSLEKAGSESDKMTNVPHDYATTPPLGNYPNAEAEAAARKDGAGDLNPYRIDITDAAKLADFKQTRTIMVEIPAPRNGKPQSSLFSGLSNVRVLEYVCG